jgi:LmbE family N-acetylglucosaminyl deacetylase
MARRAIAAEPAAEASSAAADVLVVIAHPDDELFVSGTLCLFADADLRVRLVAVTDGEGGGDDLDLVGKAALARRRQAELTRSAALLGAGRPVFLHHADVADPESGAAVWDQAALIEALSTQIAETRPELILTHGPRGGYGHAAHRLTHRCVMAAAERAGHSGAIYAFCAGVRGAFFSWHFEDASDVRVDARSFLDRRAASLACHETQADYFLQPYFPRSLRKRLSALFGYAFAFTAAGRKRVPIATPARFFGRFPIEGLSLQKAPAPDAPRFFPARFGDDHRVQIDR